MTKEFHKKKQKTLSSRKKGYMLERGKKSITGRKYSTKVKAAHIKRVQHVPKQLEMGVMRSSMLCRKFVLKLIQSSQKKIISQRKVPQTKEVGK